MLEQENNVIVKVRVKKKLWLFFENLLVRI